MTVLPSSLNEFQTTLGRARRGHVAVVPRDRVTNLSGLAARAVDLTSAAVAALEPANSYVVNRGSERG
jgi:hypothetical protein